MEEINSYLVINFQIIFLIFKVNFRHSYMIKL